MNSGIPGPKRDVRDRNANDETDDLDDARLQQRQVASSGKSGAEAADDDTYDATTISGDEEKLDQPLKY